MSGVGGRYVDAPPPHHARFASGDRGPRTSPAIRRDNGPEMSSRHYLVWCVEHKIDAIRIQPGKPKQNAHVESFHGRLRDECLNVSWFWNLWDARRKIAAWRTEYNTERPHIGARVSDARGVCGAASRRSIQCWAGGRDLKRRSLPPDLHPCSTRKLDLNFSYAT